MVENFISNNYLNLKLYYYNLLNIFNFKTRRLPEEYSQYILNDIYIYYIYFIDVISMFRTYFGREKDWKIGIR